MDKVETLEQHLQQIMVALKDEDINKIILFGSVADGRIHEDSDLDLLLIMDTDYLPKTYKERIEYRLEIQRKVRPIAKRIPIDLLIYTRIEYEMLTENMNAFMREIHDFGRVVYEKAS
jgi:uncharacterized protein